ncbi:23S rRNA (uracil1939-C5)-methyltransferase [Anaerosolibacter carboniphilus]|uniref:23S rRNA (Uracil1939-C5)-methyltransferase n=1 Tax=Anaerosolibacter carboniphilus TaxID=1417629 RepID=A0A841KQ19_9FIRM|nr:23S rRNA (uracil(1939)-C(5))-methyltransferase RlmD [Anaerosolibacter carboniphilus]MBB6215854.1 23S rRNA (uracil1939-C5)-methyltransferase [Anaerosolibacter carboniphilus]
MKNNIVEKNKIYEVHIDDIGHNGEGIGRIEGFTVFVQGGVPGDDLRVKIELVKKNYAVGKIIKLVAPSPSRIIPVCPIADTCGGCQTQHIDYKEQLRLKTNTVKANIERIGKLEGVLIHDTLGMEEPSRYRNKAQFPVGNLDNEVAIGFYKKGTHEIVNTSSCYIQHEVNDRIVEVLREYMERYKVSAFDEENGMGLIRHILTKVGFTTGEIMIVLITNRRKIPHQEELIQALISEVPEIKSIVQNINMKKTNRILGDECITLFGDDKIVDYIGSLKFHISALSFFQVNPMQTKVLYEKALEYAGLTGEETVFDVYCGIGTISLFLAQKAKKVYGIEIVDAAIEDAKENARINGVENAEFFVGKAEEVVPRLYKKGITADVVVVDPPRKGCEEEVLDTIVKMNPKRVVYVSCNPSTLARDLKYLDERGYRTVEVQPVDMFPHTTHCEAVVKIERV